MFRAVVAKLTSNDLFAVLSSTFAITLLATTIQVLSFHGFSEGDKTLTLIAIYFVFPLFVSLIYLSPRYFEHLFSRSTAQIVLFINLVYILYGVNLFYDLSHLVKHTSFVSAPLIKHYVITLAGFLILASWRTFTPLFVLIAKMLEPVNWVLGAGAAVAFLVAVVFPADWLGTARVDWVAFYCGIAVAVFLCLLPRGNAFLTSIPRVRMIVKYGVTGVVFLFPLLMMDARATYDALHYTAYLAPANAVANGGIPLVDVFSQYGQSYLLYALGFLVLPHTYHAAAIVTSAATALYLLGFLLILRKVVHGDIMFFVGGCLSLFFFMMFHHHNMNTTPSHGGMRYLPPMLVAVALTYIGQRRFSPLSIAALAICCFWSFEAMLYGSSIYLAFLIAEAGMRSDRFSDALRAISKNIGAFAAVVAGIWLGIVGVYLISVGRLPRYDLYLDLVGSYVGNDPFMEYRYVQANFYAWMVPVLVYFAGLCFIARQVFGCKEDKSSWVPQLAIMTALGVCLGMYCFISTQAFILKVTLLPFYLFLFWAFELTGRALGRYVISGTRIMLMPVFVLIVGLMFGVGFKNFSDPPNYSSHNTVVLKSLVDDGRLLPRKYGERLENFCPLPGEEEIANACFQQAHVPAVDLSEANTMISKWMPMDRRLMLFHPQDAIHLFFNKKENVFPFSFSYVDGFSRKLFDRIVEKSHKIIMTSLPEGQVMIVTKNIATLDELQWAVLHDVLENWQAEKVDETEHLAVYRLTHRTDLNPDAVLAMPNRPVMSRNTECLRDVQHGNWCVG